MNDDFSKIATIITNNVDFIKTEKEKKIYFNAIKEALVFGFTENQNRIKQRSRIWKKRYKYLAFKMKNKEMFAYYYNMYKRL